MMDSSLQLNMHNLAGDKEASSFRQAQTPKHCNKKVHGTLRSSRGPPPGSQSYSNNVIRPQFFSVPPDRIQEHKGLRNGRLLNTSFPGNRSGGYALGGTGLNLPHAYYNNQLSSQPSQGQQRESIPVTVASMSNQNNYYLQVSGPSNVSSSNGPYSIISISPGEKSHSNTDKRCVLRSRPKNSFISNNGPVPPAGVSYSSSWESKGHGDYKHYASYNGVHNSADYNVHNSVTRNQLTSHKYNTREFGLPNHPDLPNINVHRGHYSSQESHCTHNNISTLYYRADVGTTIHGHHQQDKYQPITNYQDPSLHGSDIDIFHTHSNLSSPDEQGRFSRTVSSSFGESVKSPTNNTDLKNSPSHRIERSAYLSSQNSNSNQVSSFQQEVQHYTLQKSGCYDGSDASEAESDKSWKQLNQVTSIDEDKYHQSQKKENERDRNTFTLIAGHTLDDIQLPHSPSNTSSLSSSPVVNLIHSKKSKSLLNHLHYPPLLSPSKLASLDSLSSVASIQEPIDTSYSNDHEDTAKKFDFYGVPDLMQCKSNSGSLQFSPKIEDFAKRPRDDHGHQDNTNYDSKNDDTRKLPPYNARNLNDFTLNKNEESPKAKRSRSVSANIDTLNRKTSESKCMPSSSNYNSKSLKHTSSNETSKQQHHSYGISSIDKHSYHDMSQCVEHFSKYGNKNSNIPNLGTRTDSVSSLIPNVSVSHTDRSVETMNDTNRENIPSSILSWEVNGHDSFGGMMPITSTDSGGEDNFNGSLTPSCIYQVPAFDCKPNNSRKYLTCNSSNHERNDTMNQLRRKPHYLNRHPISVPLLHQPLSNSVPQHVVSESSNQSFDGSYNSIRGVMPIQANNMDVGYCVSNMNNRVRSSLHNHDSYNKQSQNNMLPTNSPGSKHCPQSSSPGNYPTYTPSWGSHMTLLSGNPTLEPHPGHLVSHPSQIPKEVHEPLFRYDVQPSFFPVGHNNQMHSSLIPSNNIHHAFQPPPPNINPHHVNIQLPPTVHVISSHSDHSNIHGRHQLHDPSLLRKGQGGVYFWSVEDDMRLTNIMKKYKNPRDWKPIAKEFGQGKTSKECNERWIRYLKPGVRKGQWQDHEDAIVVDSVTTSIEQPFTRWSDLAQRLPGRVGKQIRDRWVNHLNPNINHMPFSRNDDLNLWEGHKELGKRWVEISSKYFSSSRSENHIKNRWYSASFKKFIANEFGANAYSGGSKSKNKVVTSKEMTARITAQNNS